MFCKISGGFSFERKGRRKKDINERLGNSQVFEDRLKLFFGRQKRLNERKRRRKPSPLEDLSLSQDKADAVQHIRHAKRR